MAAGSNRLVIQRKILGLTQEEAAEKIGIRREILSKYENGKITPRSSTWEKIAQAYNMPAAFLRGDDLIDCESSEIIFTQKEKRMPDDKKLLSLNVKKELIKLLQEMNKNYSSRQQNQLLSAMEFVIDKRLFGKTGGKLWVNLNVDTHELSCIKQTMIELAKLKALCLKNKES